MRLNPEFRRNLSLELTPHRLVAMPLVILLVCLLAFALAGRERGLNAAGWAAFWLYAAITVFWGTQLACNSVLNEFRDKTWDTQRLSALSPWTIAWGKLLGGTVFAWYGGAICIPVFVVSRVFGLPDGSPAIAWPALALALTGGALLLHAAGLLFSLLLPRGGQRSSSHSIALLLFGVVAAWPLAMGLTMREPVQWWGANWSTPWFCVASCWTFAAWAVTGVHRRLCVELQVRTTPAVWLAFAVFLTFYSAGFAVGRIDNMPAPTVLAAAGFVVCLLLTYVSAWVEKRDAITVRRLLLRARNAERRRCLEEMPCWLATAPLALMFSLFLLVQDHTPYAPEKFDGRIAALALVAVLMAVRDIGLLYFFSFSRSGRNAEMTTVIYLVILYWPMPALLSAVGAAPVAAALLPFMSEQPGMAIAAALAQAALVVWLAVARWRKQVQAVSSS